MGRGAGRQDVVVGAAGTPLGLVTAGKTNNTSIYRNLVRHGDPKSDKSKLL